MSFELEKLAADYAEKCCNGNFPIEYTREQVVRHTKEDFIEGAKAYKAHVLSVLRENLAASERMDDSQRDLIHADILTETYNDLILIFDKQKQTT